VPPSKGAPDHHYLGGGYGSKSYTKFEPLRLALARKAKQPCAFATPSANRWSRASSRGASRIKSGVKRDGTIMAREAEIYLDTGGTTTTDRQVTARSATRVSPVRTGS